MLRIRLARGGRKKVPYFRIIVTNRVNARDSGNFLEKVGTYNPLLDDVNEKRVTVDRERIEYWLSVGAQPSDRVAKFLSDLGVKGAEKFKPGFKPKAKGSNLKKKAQERVQKEAEAKEQAAKEAAEATAAA